MRKLKIILALVMAGAIFMAVNLPVRAFESGPEVLSLEATAPAVPALLQKSVEYALPYPGVLPGSPLYPLKMVRDRLIGFLIVDKIKKADYLLLLADKRLGAGQALVEYNQLSLGETTISKGEKYLEAAVAKLYEAKKEGKDTSFVLGKFLLAAAKHKEIITGLAEKAPDLTKALEITERAIASLEKINE